MRFGVDTFIWSEVFSEKDLWVITKAEELGFSTIDIAIAHPETFPTALVKAEMAKTKLEVVTTTTLDAKTNLISPDEAIRKNGVEALKRLVDINKELGSTILGGVNYAGWGCLSGKPKTDEEWNHSVEAMREAARYAKETHPQLRICVEPVNRFETHFINTAKEGVRYCKAVGTGNMAVHLDCFHMIREETSYREAVEVCVEKRIWAMCMYVKTTAVSRERDWYRGRNSSQHYMTSDMRDPVSLNPLIQALKN